ncbi:hypothetical protein MRB53_010814 [Persea americana]|uniref:Uncharacterized protein n=1 Tax=Persea americana TaxID=3435 RepID=A0ACC2LT23_PERAE|nr:hypothetical protein MRB53_010814 [Persea americana]
MYPTVRSLWISVFHLDISGGSKYHACFSPRSPDVIIVTPIHEEVKGADGRLYYVVVPKDGFWPFSDSSDKSIDLSRCKLQLGDFAHAMLTLMVFAVVALLSPNVVGCYYPSFESTQKTLLVVLPSVVGFITSAVFAVFPHIRHGIGYPPAYEAAVA